MRVLATLKPFTRISIDLFITGKTTIRKINNIPSKFSPRMRINTFFNIMLKRDRTEFSFIFEKQEICVKSHSTQKFNIKLGI